MKALIAMLAATVASFFVACIAWALGARPFTLSMLALTSGVWLVSFLLLIAGIGGAPERRKEVR